MNVVRRGPEASFLVDFGGFSPSSKTLTGPPRGFFVLAVYTTLVSGVPLA
jgi:hypothetical protein